MMTQLYDVKAFSPFQLKEHLLSNVMRVTFRKKTTGEERVMVCTNHDSVTQQEGIKPKNPNPERPENLITTYDLEKQSWRAFYFDNVNRIERLPADFKEGALPNVYA